MGYAERNNPRSRFNGRKYPEKPRPEPVPMTLEILFARAALLAEVKNRYRRRASSKERPTP